MNRIPTYHTAVYNNLNTNQLRNLYRESRTLATMGQTAESVALFDSFATVQANREIDAGSSKMSFETQMVSEAVVLALTSLTCKKSVGPSEQTWNEGGFLQGSWESDSDKAKQIVLGVLRKYL